MPAPKSNCPNFGRKKFAAALCPNKLSKCRRPLCRTPFTSSWRKLAYVQYGSQANFILKACIVDADRETRMKEIKLHNQDLANSVGAQRVPHLITVSRNSTITTDIALSWRDLNRISFVAAAAGIIWFLRGASSPYITAVGVACTLVGGFPIFHEAFENIPQRRMTMDLSITVALVAALAIREIFTALIIMLCSSSVGPGGHDSRPRQASDSIPD